MNYRGYFKDNDGNKYYAEDNRAMRIYGGVAVNNVNINEYLKEKIAGTHYFGTGCTNMPSSSPTWCMIIDFQGSSSNDGAQIAIGIVSKKISFRTRNNGNYSSWFDLN